MSSRRLKQFAAVAAVGLLLAACSSSKKTSTGGGGTATTAAGGGGGYSVSTANCPPEAKTKITGTIKVGAVMPLSGGAAAVAFAPVAAGLKAYVAYANAQN